VVLFFFAKKNKTLFVKKDAKPFVS